MNNLGAFKALHALLPEDSTKETDSLPDLPPDEYGCESCHDSGFVVERGYFEGKQWVEPKLMPCPQCRPKPAPFGLSEGLRGCTFETFDLNRNRGMADAYLRCKAVAEGSEWCAMLVGTPGLGKSHLAAAALNVRGGAFWEMQALLLNIRHLAFAENGPHYDEEQVVGTWMRYQHLLVLDDVGVEKPTDWAGQTEYAILNARYQAKLPTIITSNRGERIDDRILSRFAEGAVSCRGTDQRGRR